MVTIDLLNKDAMALLRDMEKLNLISVKDDGCNPYVIKEKPYKKGAAQNLYGSLKMNPERTEEFLNNIQESRKEWERSIV